MFGEGAEEDLNKQVQQQSAAISFTGASGDDRLLDICVVARAYPIISEVGVCELNWEVVSFRVVCAHTRSFYM